MSREDKKNSRVTPRFPTQDSQFLEHQVEDGEYINTIRAARDATKRPRADRRAKRDTRVEKKETALLAYGEDIERAGVKDWIASHTSFMLPLHKYRGEITLLEDSIFFRGEDKDTGQPHVLALPLKNVLDLHYGFDDAYRRTGDRGLGLFTSPLRIRFKEGSSQKTIYLWIGFRRLSRTSDNREWFESLSNLKRESRGRNTR